MNLLQSITGAGAGRILRHASWIVAACLLSFAEVTAEIYPTEYLEDLAIDGPGAFLLRRAGSTEYFVTREGSFHIDAEGILTTWNGEVLQGFRSTTSSAAGDLKLEPPDPAFWRVSIRDNGVVVLSTSAGESQIIGQVLLLWYPGLNDTIPHVGPRIFGNNYELPPDILPELELWQFRPGVPPVGRLQAQHRELATDLSLTRLSPAELAQEHGLVLRTGNRLDLVLRGPGWFLLRDPQTQEAAVTRAGVFERDPEGYLVTLDGLRLQAEPLAGGPPATWPTDRPRFCDVQVPFPTVGDDPLSGATPWVHNFWIEPSGGLELLFSDNTSQTPMRVGLAEVLNPETLSSRGFGVLRFPSLDGVTMVDAGSPSTRFGRIEAGGLDPQEIPPDLQSRFSTMRRFSQATIRPVRPPGWMALAGDGFFMVRDPVTSQTLATRAGCFSLTDDGYFELPGGYRLLGERYAEPLMGSVADLRALDTWRPPALDPLPPGTVSTFGGISTEGQIQNDWPDHSSVMVGGIRLQQFRNPSALRIKVDDPCGFAPEFLEEEWGPLDPQNLVPNLALFEGYEAALPIGPAGLLPGHLGAGSIQYGYIEIPMPVSGFLLPDLTTTSAYRLDSGITPVEFYPWVQWSEDLTNWNSVRGYVLPADRGYVLIDNAARSTSPSSTPSATTARFYRWAPGYVSQALWEIAEHENLSGPNGWGRKAFRRRGLVPFPYLTPPTPPSTPVLHAH